VDRALDGLLGLDAAKPRIRRPHPTRLQVVPTHERIKAPRVILYGWAPPAPWTASVCARLTELVRVARRHHLKTIAVLRHDPIRRRRPAACRRRQRHGHVGEAFSADREPERVAVDELLLSGFGAQTEAAIAAAVQAGEATNRARELQNLPGNELTPEAWRRKRSASPSVTGSRPRCSVRPSFARRATTCCSGLRSVRTAAAPHHAAASARPAATRSR